MSRFRRNLKNKRWIQGLQEKIGDFSNHTKKINERDFFCSPGPNLIQWKIHTKWKFASGRAQKRWERKIKTCIRFNVVINIDVLWTFKVTTEKFNFTLAISKGGEFWCVCDFLHFKNLQKQQQQKMKQF